MKFSSMAKWKVNKQRGFSPRAYHERATWLESYVDQLDFSKM